MTLTAGFFGKIPSRGDFVRHGLPRDFVTALDGWWQRVLAESRTLLGAGWTDAWMEAPVWRFALPPGCCGPSAAAGLWLPSTDKAGRLFPLTFAVVGSAGWGEVAQAAAFLDAAEAIGLRSLEEDCSPADLAQAVAAAAMPGGDPIEAPRDGMGRWWTEGSPLVAPTTQRIAGMPDGATFAAMLRDAPAG